MKTNLFSALMLALACVACARSGHHLASSALIPSKQRETTTSSTEPTTTSTEAGTEAEVTSGPVGDACGVERWDVKTGTDDAAALVNLQATQQTTIAQLDALTRPSDPTSRVAPVETTVYELHATLTEYKVEADRDYHLVLDDSAGHTMIAEIPEPDCVTGGPLKPSITQARAAMEARFPPDTERFVHTAQPVTVRGVGFFDFKHGQTGVAPNAIELHPVLAISFQ